MILQAYEHLTKCQVEALLECFDFLANGYQEFTFIKLDDVWIVWLKHTRTHKDLHVFIHENYYKIRVNQADRKTLFFKPSSDRFRVLVNSDASVGVVRECSGAS